MSWLDMQLEFKAEQERDERLERIALAILSGLIAVGEPVDIVVKAHFAAHRASEVARVFDTWRARDWRAEEPPGEGPYR